MSASGFITMTVGTFLYIYLSERRLNSEAAKELPPNVNGALSAGGREGVSEA
jgi:hypothetical protein